VLLLIVGVVTPFQDLLAVQLTSTGFYYPTGTSNLGNYAGWLAQPPDYFDDYYHIGKDIVASEGAAVYAISNGTVIGISSGGWGTNNKGVFIRHTLADGSQFVALYGHVRTNKVVNDAVQAGVQFATIGPYSPTHLHFGIHPGSNMPPAPYGMLPLPVTPPYNGWVDPINWITTRSPSGAFSCSWHTQDPNYIVTMHAGQTRTFTVSYTNTGTTTFL
jgi:murein DD-endopeptidase MepM/ murein hydrolase activator NlpD